MDNFFRSICKNPSPKGCFQSIAQISTTDKRGNEISDRAYCPWNPCKIAKRINILDRVVLAICKHIVAEEALTSGGVAVGVDEAAQGGVVISALEVIKARLRDCVLP